MRCRGNRLGLCDFRPLVDSQRGEVKMVRSILGGRKRAVNRTANEKRVRQSEIATVLVGGF